MLPLNDPLWQKLDDAHRDRNIPGLLRELAETWNDEAARSLFWDCLCHQGSCYGATYAAIPHLLTIAGPERNRHQRFEVAVFTGYVALCVFASRKRSADRTEPPPLEGLPETLDGWDQKLDCYRGIAAILQDPNRRSSDYEQTEMLPHARQILAIAPVNASDLEKIRSIRAEFLSLLPEIRGLCERALLEHLQDQGAARHLLLGIAAIDGLLDLAHLLESGTDGRFHCASCHWDYEYILFGDRIAIYADEDAAAAAHGPTATRDRALHDFKERAPSRSDGFLVPVRDDEIADHRATALLALAGRCASPEPTLLLRNFLGSFRCCKCGLQASIRAL